MTIGKSWEVNWKLARNVMRTGGFDQAAARLARRGSPCPYEDALNKPNRPPGSDSRRHQRTGTSEQRLLTKFAMLRAWVPRMFVVVTSVVPIVITFARPRNDAARCYREETEQKAELNNPSHIFHWALLSNC
jgi:hypothetical protein